jgi:hypothetical protein
VAGDARRDLRRGVGRAGRNGQQEPAQEKRREKACTPSERSRCKGSGIDFHNSNLYPINGVARQPFRQVLNQLAHFVRVRRALTDFPLSSFLAAAARVVSPLWWRGGFFVVPNLPPPCEAMVRNRVPLSPFPAKKTGRIGMRPAGEFKAE